MRFETGGPERYAHQKRGLRWLIDTGGVGALLFDPGCIYGDAEMVVNRGGKSFRIDLRTLVHMLNGGGRGRWGTQKWDLSIPTMIGRWTEDDTLRLVQITGAWESGVKMTYTVTTETGRSIRATDEHPFLTVNGWRRLDELKPGDAVMVRGPQATGEDREPKPRYRERAGLRFHPHAYKRDAATSPYRVAEHRLVVEAHRSGFTLPQYLDILRWGRTPPRPIQFLPRGKVVHHKNGDPKDNRIENLEVLDSQAEHNAVHDVTSRVLHKAVPERVVSIEPYGEEETFDLEVADDPHCFLADGFVVHNTGKTAVVIDYAGLLALKSTTGEVRVLVVCPLVAVDTWVMQMEKFASPQVHYWAEALGGSLLQRAEAMAARGGNLHTKSLRTGKPQQFSVGTHPRALHWDKSWAWATSEKDLLQKQGPDAVPTPRIVLEVINIDTLTQRTKVGRQTMADVMVDAIKRFNPELVVVDESHKIKAATGNASRLLARVTKFVKRRVILTGTVMPTSPLDVFGQWRFLEPYAFGSKQADGTVRQATFNSFKGRFAEMGGWMGKEVKGYHNLDDMQRIMVKNAVVARKKDVLDLPPTTDVILPVELSPAEKKAYVDLKTQLATKLSSGELVSVTNRLPLMMRLRQITSGHVPEDGGGMRIVGKSKVETIRSLVHDSLVGEKRIVVFALFTVEIEMLRKALDAPGTEIMVIDGSTPKDDRIRMRKRFGSDSSQRMIMIAQIKTMSLAVNELVTASHAVFASMSQQRDDYIQARDRLDRIGQTSPVTFWHAIAPGTVDEVILKSHRERTNLEDAMLKHIQEGAVGQAPAFDALGLFGGR